MKNRSRKIFAIIAAICVCASLTACTEKSDHKLLKQSNDTIISESDSGMKKNPMNKPDKPAIKSEYEYDLGKSIEIIDKLYDDAQTNIIYSDMSFNYALNMAMLGADNATLKQIEDYYNCDAETVSDYYSALLNEYNSNEEIEVKIANSVWTDLSIKLKSDYITNVNSKYNAIAEALDFHESASADRINKWCADNTNNKIPEIVTPAMLADNKNILVNALYFNAEWMNEFKDFDIDEEGKFRNLDGSESNITMMSCEENIYYENDHAYGFAKSYSDSTFKFIGILPKNLEIKDFDVKDLDIENLLENQYITQVRVEMPKFKIETTTELSDILKTTGLDDMFGSKADFTNMIDPAENNTGMCVTDVLQKTYIDVNKKGTEAAAVTSFSMKSTAISHDVQEFKEVILDRPFIFMIYDVKNDQCLFMGKMTDMSMLG